MLPGEKTRGLTGRSTPLSTDTSRLAPDRQVLLADGRFSIRSVFSSAVVPYHRKTFRAFSLSSISCPTSRLSFLPPVFVFLQFYHPGIPPNSFWYFLFPCSELAS